MAVELGGDFSEWSRQLLQLVKNICMTANELSESSNADPKHVFTISKSLGGLTASLIRHIHDQVDCGSDAAIDDAVLLLQQDLLLSVTRDMQTAVLDLVGAIKKTVSSPLDYLASVKLANACKAIADAASGILTAAKGLEGLLLDVIGVGELDDITKLTHEIYRGANQFAIDMDTLAAVVVDASDLSGSRSSDDGSEESRWKDAFGKARDSIDALLGVVKRAQRRNFYFTSAKTATLKRAVKSFLSTAKWVYKHPSRKHIETRLDPAKHQIAMTIKGLVLGVQSIAYGGNLDNPDTFRPNPRGSARFAALDLSDEALLEAATETTTLRSVPPRRKPPAPPPSRASAFSRSVDSVSSKRLLPSHAPPVRPSRAKKEWGSAADVTRSEESGDSPTGGDNGGDNDGGDAERERKASDAESTVSGEQTPFLGQVRLGRVLTRIDSQERSLAGQRLVWQFQKKFEWFREGWESEPQHVRDETMSYIDGLMNTLRTAPEGPVLPAQRSDSKLKRPQVTTTANTAPSSSTSPSPSSSSSSSSSSSPSSPSSPSSLSTTTSSSPSPSTPTAAWSSSTPAAGSSSSAPASVGFVTRKLVPVKKKRSTHKRQGSAIFRLQQTRRDSSASLRDTQSEMLNQIATLPEGSSIMDVSTEDETEALSDKRPVPEKKPPPAPSPRPSSSSSPSPPTSPSMGSTMHRPFRAYQKASLASIVQPLPNLLSTLVNLTVQAAAAAAEAPAPMRKGTLKLKAESEQEERILTSATDALVVFHGLITNVSTNLTSLTPAESEILNRVSLRARKLAEPEEEDELFLTPDLKALATVDSNVTAKLLLHSVEKGIASHANRVKANSMFVMALIQAADKVKNKSQVHWLSMVMAINATTESLVEFVQAALTKTRVNYLIADGQFELDDDANSSGSALGNDDAESNIWDTESTDEPYHNECGTLDALVRHLTSPHLFDSQFTQSFFMTYRSFVTPTDLFHKMEQRFNVPASVDKDIARKIRFRVAVVVKQWISSAFYDFDLSLIRSVKQFAEHMKTTGDLELARALQKMVARKEEESMERASQLQASIQTIVVPQTQLSPMEMVLTLDDACMAEHLTLLDFRIFATIETAELLNQAWNKPSLMHRSPNVTALIVRLNQLSHWVCSLVLWESDAKRRAELLSKFMRVAKILRQKNNFHTLMGIIVACNMSSVSRLKSAHALVKKKLAAEFKQMQDMMSPQGSYGEYRTVLASARHPVLPYIGVVLTDLTFIEEGNSDTLEIDGREVVNYGKRNLIYRVVDQVLYYQRTPYPAALNPTAQALLLTLPHLEEKELYNMSLLREPRKLAPH